MIDTATTQNQALAKTIVSVLPLLAKFLQAQASGMGNNLILSQLQILKWLSFNPMTMSELAHVMDVAKPTMTRTVNALSKRGWVSRNQSAQDGRVFEISLAPAGKQVLTEAEQCLTLGLGDFLAPLSVEEKQTVRAGFDILQRLLQSENGDRASQTPQT